MRSFQFLGLFGLALASCRAASASDRYFQDLLAEQKPAVVQELGLTRDVAWTVEQRPGIEHYLETVILDQRNQVFRYRPDWEDMGSRLLKAYVTHELVHLAGPVYPSHALTEGLADVIAVRVCPEAQGAALMSHWVEGPKDTEQLAGPLLDLGRPESEREDAELRAVGFMVFYCMSRAEIQEFIATGQSSKMDELRQMALHDLWNLAARTMQPPSLEQQAEPGYIPPEGTPMETVAGPVIWLE